MKTYYNGPKGMRYGGTARKPMMYGGMPKKPKKKMMGGMAKNSTEMSAGKQMTQPVQPMKMASGGKNKKLAAMYGDPNKVTRGDIIAAAKKKNKMA